MNVLDRIYNWLDRLRAPGQHVTFGPTRTPSELLELHLAPSRLEDIHPCCKCCGPTCDDMHRDPCPLHQAGAMA